MQNKKIKIITILLTVVLMFCITNIAFATDNFNFSRFENTINANTKADESAKSIMGTGIQVIRIVGTATSIIMLTYIAIKYMLAAPSEKADLKKSLVIFVVGATLIFATTNILTIISFFINKNITW